MWEAATILRGPADPANLRDFVFPLLFLKRLSDTWQEERQKAVAATARVDVTLVEKKSAPRVLESVEFRGSAPPIAWTCDASRAHEAKRKKGMASAPQACATLVERCAGPRMRSAEVVR